VAPTVQITAPASGSTVSGTVTLTSTASDDVGVVSVAYWSGPTRLGSATKQSDGTWRAAFTSRSYPNGTYPVVAKATDAAGNVGTSPAVTLTIRN